MREISLELQTLLDNYYPLLRSLTEDRASIKPGNKWSKKELIGHLIDSAQNNIRRFITAQYEEATITYRQDEWVLINDHQHRELQELVQLWYLLNKLICGILKNTPEEKKNNICFTPEAHSIEWLAEDYIKHLKHHIHQVLDLEPVPYP
jgi:hypothetical protein